MLKTFTDEMRLLDGIERDSRAGSPPRMGAASTGWEEGRVK
jgi:hypothetical protein